MAMAKEVMGGGFSAGQATALGGGSGSVAAAGSASTDATAVNSSIVIATAADGTKGVILTGQVGDEVWIFNNAASTLKVYPPAGAAIDVTGTGLGTANAAYSLLTFKVGLFKCQSATQWFVVVT